MRSGAGDQAIDDARGGDPEAVVEAGLLHHFQSRETGCHGDRIAGQGAGLIDGAERREALHHVTASAKGSKRHAAADHLSQGGQVGGHPEQPLGAARAHAKAGHDLVEDQQRAMAPREVSQGSKECRRGHDQVHVADHRLDDHRRDIGTPDGESLLESGNIVVVEYQRVLGGIGRHAGRTGLAERERARPRLD